MSAQQFSDHSLLRKFFRNIVLPVKKIKKIMMDVLVEIKMDSILDFGSGTFFWTDWFVKEFNCRIYAVDKYYGGGVTLKNNVKCYSELGECLIDCQTFSVVFACDVLHHLKPIDCETFFKEIINKTKVIIIKDIDKNHQFGNFMNRMHDKIINKENIYNIDPNIIENNLISNGYKTHYYYIPKLWYPHFIIIGIK